MTVASHIIEILRQGVWASLTGGWFYDPRQSTFCNTVHLYLWLILFVLPLITALCFDFSSWYSIFIHCAIVGVLFAVVKAINLKLHSIFDTHEAIEQQETSSLDRTAIPTTNSNSATGASHAAVTGSVSGSGVRPTPVESRSEFNEGRLFGSNSDIDSRRLTKAQLYASLDASGGLGLQDGFKLVDPSYIEDEDETEFNAQTDQNDVNSEKVLVLFCERKCFCLFVIFNRFFDRILR